AAARCCTLCPLETGHKPIFQIGQRAPILLASQAPGTLAHASGIPFNDPSGRRLRDWLGVDRACFYNPDNFCILPMGLCFPGQNAKGADLPPRKECAPQWREAILQRLPNIRLTLLIGQYAQAWHLGPRRGKSLRETVANWQAYWPDHLVLPHPSWRNNAWLARNPWFEADILPVVKHRVQTLLREAA
ncbi:MAG: uracil-DNA glycosylase family protein, partial [Pseudomonadota bacterium]